MKNIRTAIFWIIVVIGGVFFLSHSNGISSHSSSSSSPEYYDGDNGYDDEEETLDYDEALSSYWDDIKSYVNGSETIEACSDESGNCYDLDADIEDGCIDEIHFDNGGYLDFSYACLDENGEAADTDDEGRGWTFTLDTDSSIVTDAVDEWASDNGYTIE